MDVKLVTVPCPFRIRLHITADELHQVMGAASPDGCRRRTYKTPAQVFVHHGHDGVYADTVIHRKNLQLPCLSVFMNDPFTVAADTERAVRYTFRELLYNFLPVREQVTPLAAPFT